MTVPEILKLRLQNQWLLGSPAKSGADVVRQLLAVQAQDYLGSLWALGQRVPESTEQSIEQQLSNGSIIRTWPMRGTLHFVAAEDARWLVGFLAPRVLPKTRSIYRNAGLDDATLTKCTRIVTKILEKEKVLTRDELYERLNRERVNTDDSRGLHITGYLAIQGITCFGPRKGKQQTFVLRDEWLHATKPFVPEEVEPTLAIRYFCGHGPATLKDLAWWSGLNLTEAKQAILAAGSKLVSIKVKDETYYTAADQVFNTSQNSAPGAKVNATHMLPAFDEFTVAYKERKLMLARDQQHRGSMEVLSPVVSINGTLAGTWNRSLSNNKVNIRIKPFSSIGSTQISKINSQVKKYAHFVGVDHSAVEKG